MTGSLRLNISAREGLKVYELPAVMEPLVSAGAHGLGAADLVRELKATFQYRLLFACHFCAKDKHRVPQQNQPDAVDNLCIEKLLWRRSLGQHRIPISPSLFLDHIHLIPHTTLRQQDGPPILT